MGNIRNVAAAWSHPCWALPKGYLSVETWDWLLGLVPVVPGKEISGKTALAAAVLAGGHTWSRIRCSARRDAAQSSGTGAGDGINMAQGALRERNWS